LTHRRPGSTRTDIRTEVPAARAGQRERFAHDKIQRLARTIADLAAAPDICDEHIAEAISYRTLDRNLWA